MKSRRRRWVSVLLAVVLFGAAPPCRVRHLGRPSSSTTTTQGKRQVADSVLHRLRTECDHAGGREVNISGRLLDGATAGVSTCAFDNSDGSFSRPSIPGIVPAQPPCDGPPNFYVIIDANLWIGLKHFRSVTPRSPDAQRLPRSFLRSGWRDSNPRPSVPQTRTGISQASLDPGPSLSYDALCVMTRARGREMRKERVGVSRWVYGFLVLALVLVPLVAASCGGGGGSKSTTTTSTTVAGQQQGGSSGGGSSGGGSSAAAAVLRPRRPQRRPRPRPPRRGGRSSCRHGPATPATSSRTVASHSRGFANQVARASIRRADRLVTPGVFP